MDSTEGIGSTASYGYIKAVTLRNFMCHEELSLTFTDKLNFVIGRNGSGKSAVLCAIILGLGGKACFANRAHLAADYIRYGHNSADIVVTLCNEGPCAYLPEKYGKEIIVHRRLHRSYSSRYELKSADGRLVSTKAADVNAILRHFNIQVQNPACILTQDHSRNFLHALNSRSLYQFYMESTQLAGIKLDLVGSHESTEEARKTMEYKRQASILLSNCFIRHLYPFLQGMEMSKTLVSQMEEKLKQLELKQEAEMMLGKVEKELRWALVEHHELEVKHATDAINDKQQEVSARAANFKAKKASLKQLGIEAAGYRNEVNACEQMVRGYEVDIEKCNMEAEGKRSEIAQKKAVLASLKTEAVRVSEQIERYEEKMKDVQGRNHSADGGDKHTPKQRRDYDALQLDVKALMQAIHVADRDILQMTNSVSNLERSLQEKRNLIHYLTCLPEQGRSNTSFRRGDLGGSGFKLKGEPFPQVSGMIKYSRSNHWVKTGQLTAKFPSLGVCLFFDMPKRSSSGSSDLGTELGRVHELIRANNLKVSSLRSSADDRLARFGVKERNLAVMVHGKHKKLFSKEPRGPIGSLITVLDSQWNRAVECCLGSLLNSYVCDNFKDANILRGLASNIGIAPESLDIIVVEFGNEQPYRLPDSLRNSSYCTVLSVVKCDDAVVQNVLIDKRGIEKTALFADESTMVKVMRNSRVFALAFSADGDQCITRPCFRKYRPPLRRAYLLTSSNEDAIKQLNDECKELAANKETVQKEIDSLNNRMAELRDELSARKTDMEELRKSLGVKQARINAMRTAQAESSDFERDLSLFERQVGELKKKLASVKAQQTEQETQIAHAEGQMNQLRSAFEQMEQNRLQTVKRQKEAAEKLSMAEFSLHLAAEELEALTKEIKDAKVELERLESERKACGRRLKNAMTEAQETSPVRVSVQRPIEEVKRHLEQLQLAVGVPVESEYTMEELVVELDISRAKLSSITGEYKEACSTLEDLSRQLENRDQFFLSLRRKVDTSMEDIFKSYITLRYKDSGLIIDHEKQLLEIYIVSTGGERSFATICLLLSLWEITDLPFRCLDEFDVFMDMVNRDTAINMLIDYAGQPKNLHRQFIFFSPLHVSDSMRTSTVSLIRIAAEEAEAEE
ncbi:RecF/RecN/SMC protein [Trichuris suis]|nr:RecF/RecN/SMC protein [Trichuris suis]